MQEMIRKYLFIPRNILTFPHPAQSKDWKFFSLELTGHCSKAAPKLIADQYKHLIFGGRSETSAFSVTWLQTRL